MGHNFNDDEDGIVPIFIKKAVEAEHGTETGWNSSFGDDQAVFSAPLAISTSYLEINGQTGSGETGSTYGFKVQYSTDTANNGLVTTSTGKNVSYVKFYYTEFQQSGIDHIPDIKSVCIYVNRISYWTISHCYIHDSNSALTIFSNGPDHLTIEYNWFTERHTNGKWHGSALVINNPGPNNGSIIRYNVFKNIAGTCIIEPKNVGSLQNWSHLSIYGNVFYSTSDYYNPMAAICDVLSNPGESSYVYVLNNTFVLGSGT